VLLPLVLLSVIGSAGVSAPAAGGTGSSPTLHARLGDRTVTILRGSTGVEVFRVDPASYLAPGKEDPEKKSSFQRYAVTARGKNQGAEFAARAAGLLLDPAHFALDSGKGCTFSPGVGLRFRKGKETAEVLLCFRCDDLEVVTPNPQSGGVRRFFADFHPGRASFVRLVKEAFPEDALIQGLKEKGE